MISVENLTKVYHTRQGPNVVLDNLTFEVARGQHIGILGRNGSGKSTLIRLISGAEPPTRGRIRRSMRVSWPLAFSGGFQAYLTGVDNLRFVCRIYGASFEQALPFVEEFTELGAYLREPVRHYSNGMRARLAFALSMAIDFDCFLVDEVIAVGDSRFHEKCKVELFQKRKDRAMVFVSHNPSVIRAYCDSACVLDAGKLRAFASVTEAYEYYETAR